MLLLVQRPRSRQHPFLDNAKETGPFVKQHSENFPSAFGMDVQAHAELSASLTYRQIKNSIY
tara:strand:+ start:317 stop:502 length:186 start_codon:yes stop_codon:yes gene_type:complete